MSTEEWFPEHQAVWGCWGIVCGITRGITLPQQPQSCPFLAPSMLCSQRLTFQSLSDPSLPSSPQGRSSKWASALKGPPCVHLLFHFQGLHSGHKVAGHIAFSSSDERPGQPPVSNSTEKGKPKWHSDSCRYLWGALTALPQLRSHP